MANWANLHDDLLWSIAKRIDSLEDFVAFGMVCTSWRSAATKEIFNGSLQQVPWLMLAEREEEEDGSDIRDFYNLKKGGVIHNLVLPEVKGKKCIESLGWLVTSSKEGEMNLLHPLSRAQIALPHQASFKYYDEYWMEPSIFIWKAVLSSRPSVSSQPAAASDYVLMVVHGGGGHRGFWRPGDSTWTVIETRDSPFSDIAYCRGQFYAVDNQGTVFVVCDVSGPNATVARPVGGIPTRFTRMKQLYLVESAGALMVVARDGVQLDGPDEEHLDYGTKKFEVYEVDLNNGGWKEVKDLGNRALFVGHSASTSVEASRFLGIIKPNCIYYTDDCFQSYLSEERYPHGGGKDMGIYSLEDGSIEPHYKGKSFSRICPPVWVSPSF